MEVIFTSCAGLDVHKKRITACRVTPDPTGQQADGLLELRECGTLTVDLLALSDWLAEAGITHVAMGSTGEYWTPVSNILEGEFTIFLVNAAHVQQVPGRKTDTADARWLATLMRYGLLRASFIPPVGPRDLRDLTRDRTKRVQERGREVNRVHGVLERANIKLGAVATNLFGVSGRAMLAAVIEGRADPATLAEWAKGRRRRKIPLVEQALTGLVRDHHRRFPGRADRGPECGDGSGRDGAEWGGAPCGPDQPRPARAVDPGGPAGAADLCAGGDPPGYHSGGRPEGSGAVGGGVGHRYGPLWRRRAAVGLERRRAGQ
jgi:hypothetical protein